MISLVTFSDIQDRSVAAQFLAFAEAYIDTAIQQCSHLASNPGTFNYAHGSAVLFLVFHGIELFLKGAILEKNPGEAFSGHAGHDLVLLHARYKQLHGGKDCEIEIPWSLEEPDLSMLDPRVAAAIRIRNRSRPMDQIHRYPTDRRSKVWDGGFGFEPVSLLPDILRTQAEIRRLKVLLFSSQRNIHPTA